MEHLEDFYRKHIDKVKLVVESNVKSIHDKFYKHIYFKSWIKDPKQIPILINYIKQNKESLNRSLSLLGIKHTAELKLKKSKPFFDTIVKLTDNITDIELNSDVDNSYPIQDLKDIKTNFKRPEANKNPKRENARNSIKSKDKILFPHDLINVEIPSSARNFNRYVDLGVENFPYYSYYKPNTRNTLYKKSQAKKFYGPRGTWMFDLMYFSDYNTKKHRRQAIYLVGINVNTRFAVIRRVQGKSVNDLIPAFEDLLNNELKDKFRLLIFDGEKAISSKIFEKFCIDNKINVRITYPGIHTQTAMIDRLCRTLRDDFMKVFLASTGKYNAINRKKPKSQLINYKKYLKYKHSLFEEVIKTRKLFNGEDNANIAPIPEEYVIYENLDGWGDYEYILKTNQHLIKIYDSQPKRYKRVGVNDELYRIVEVYNERPHSGLIKMLKHAKSIFGKPLPLPMNEWDDNQLDIDEVSPSIVNSNPRLEIVIIEYCKSYNNNFVENSHQYNIGDKVRVYDCFTSNRGSLINRDENYLIGDWEIVSKDNEIYGVYNNDNKQLLHVSKYMLRKA